MSTRHVAHGSTLRAKAVYAAGILVAVSLVGFLFVQYARATATYLSPNPPGYSLIADPTLVVGEPFDIGIQFTNMSDHVLIMRPLTLSHGIPAHIHILHQVITYANIVGDRGWPVGSVDHMHRVTYPLDGFRLASHTSASAVLVVNTDAPGAYIVGPTTVHADISGVIDTPLTVIHTQMTYTFFGILCVRTDDASCKAAQNTVRHQYGPLGEMVPATGAPSARVATMAAYTLPRGKVRRVPQSRAIPWRPATESGHNGEG